MARNDEEDTLLDDVKGMADRLGLKGTERRKYIHQHMTHAGYEPGDTEYMRRSENDQDDDDGGGWLGSRRGSRGSQRSSGGRGGGRKDDDDFF